MLLKRDLFSEFRKTGFSDIYAIYIQVPVYIAYISNFFQPFCSTIDGYKVTEIFINWCLDLMIFYIYGHKSITVNQKSAKFMGVVGMA